MSNWELFREAPTYLSGVSLGLPLSEIPLILPELLGRLVHRHSFFVLVPGSDRPGLGFFLLVVRQLSPHLSDLDRHVREG